MKVVVHHMAKNEIIWNDNTGSYVLGRLRFHTETTSVLKSGEELRTKQTQRLQSLN